MKAAIYPGAGRPVVIEDIAEPEPGPGEMLIKVLRCGICGTDLSMTKGEAWDYGAGVQFGHEFAGEIVGLGKGVEGFQPGDRISVLPSGACGHCPGCAGGNHVMCRTGAGVAQGFAELACVPAPLAVKLPSILSMADGALVEPLAVSLYGVRKSGLQAGADVVILGGGTVALYTIYWARRLGARRIVAMSRSARRRDLCLAMGADAFVQFGGNEAPELTNVLSGGAPAIVYECVGAEGMLMKAAMHAGVYGKVVSLGFCTRPDVLMPAMAAYQCLTYQFLVGYEMRDFLFIAEQMDKGHVDPKAIITSTVELAKLPETMMTLRARNAETKVHVVFE
ncbi:alcohol dehydrogenase catalytic domain-containing protein [Novosphingobium beihaiensis]|uniref:Alcohol dehydrogenase catalytic domain-containing protein n=1 Tax=Novosphingobium beihaiensis TaxID=2930389 RepID=A0ABT0BVJ6_9SPHN|nr:alcohol dehydrogenase catalytic domain-containing protein [Novosphingobium beihaiensis]MCJ2189015.1 alcohol dehydrogenase catalytic domain-containing protein [Novosphingobium beihaiensis]